MEKKFDKNGGFSVAMPKMTVMAPTVVNVDGPSENVASEGLICAHDDPTFFQRCEHYNTLYCKIECSEYADRKRKPEPEIYTEFEAEPEYQNQKPVSRDPEDELNVAPKE